MTALKVPRAARVGKQTSTAPSVGKRYVGKPPTITGPVLAPVGKMMWGLPLGSRAKGAGRTCVIVTSEGSVHVLFDIGREVVEILPISPRLRESLRNRLVAPRG